MSIKYWIYPELPLSIIIGKNKCFHQKVLGGGGEGVVGANQLFPVPEKQFFTRNYNRKTEKSVRRHSLENVFFLPKMMILKDIRKI